jgi:hypothetical protein
VHWQAFVGKRLAPALACNRGADGLHLKKAEAAGKERRPAAGKIGVGYESGDEGADVPIEHSVVVRR